MCWRVKDVMRWGVRWTAPWVHGPSWNLLSTHLSAQRSLENALCCRGLGSFSTVLSTLAQLLTPCSFLLTLTQPVCLVRSSSGQCWIAHCLYHSQHSYFLLECFRCIPLIACGGWAFAGAFRYAMSQLVSALSLILNNIVKSPLVSKLLNILRSILFNIRILHISISVIAPRILKSYWIVLPLGQRQYTSWSNLSTSTSASSAILSNSGSCGLCVIEATGGIQLVYWEPENAGNNTGAASPQGQAHVQVENGFTL